MAEKDKPQQPPKPRFRFLQPAEFSVLTQEEKARYLERAIEAIKGGIPMDGMPGRDRH